LTRGRVRLKLATSSVIGLAFTTLNFARRDRKGVHSLMSYYVYILESELDGTYYIGSTGDICDRLARHNQGRSMYTKAKRPWKLVYSEEHGSRSLAMKRERGIKSKKDKGYVERLIRTSRPA
jgi:putative endonuclease